MEQISNYPDPDEVGISDDERGQRLHRFLRDESGMEKDVDMEPIWAQVKERFNSPPPKGTGRKFTPKKKKRK